MFESPGMGDQGTDKIDKKKKNNQGESISVCIMEHPVHIQLPQGKCKQRIVLIMFIKWDFQILYSWLLDPDKAVSN